MTTDRRWEVGAHLLVGFRGTTVEEELAGFIDRYGIGGVVLFKRNVESREQLEKLVSDARAHARRVLGRPLLFSIDQEGGPVQRLAPHYTPLPSARELAGQGAAGVAEWVSRAASDLRRIGIQVNLAPVLDVETGSDVHYKHERTLSSEASTVAKLGRVWIETLQREGIGATAKHFPGLGRAESDPHHFAPVIRWADEAEMESELEPFAEAVRAGVRCVMTSHALYPFVDPERPATLSPAVCRGLLRDRLGFGGVLLSDDMDMAAVAGNYDLGDMARMGLGAGIDFFLVCQRPDGIGAFHDALAGAVAEGGEYARARAESLERLKRLFAVIDPSGAY